MGKLRKTRRYTIEGALVEEILITLPDGRKIAINFQGGGEGTIYLPKRKRGEFVHHLTNLDYGEKYDVYLPETGMITFRTPEGQKPLIWISGRKERK